MAIEVMLEGTLEEEKDFEGYMKFIQEIAIQNQMKMEIYEDSAFIVSSENENVPKKVKH